MTTETLKQTSRDFNITIPMGCQCTEAKVGDYKNQVELPTPEHMLQLGEVGWLTFRPTTCVDRCIAPIIEALWAKGVVTTGCCCGHNQGDGYIGVHEPTETAPVSQCDRSSEHTFTEVFNPFRELLESGIVSDKSLGAQGCRDIIEHIDYQARRIGELAAAPAHESLIQNDPAVEAIKYVVDNPTEDPVQFLNYWMHGDWDVIRRNWPEAPEGVFVNANRPAEPVAPLWYFRQVHEGWPEFNKENEFSDGEGGGKALYDRPGPAERDNRNAERYAAFAGALIADVNNNPLSPKQAAIKVAIAAHVGELTLAQLNEMLDAAITAHGITP